MRSVRQSFASSIAARMRLPCFVELRLEVLEQRERVGGAAREAREHLAVVQAPHLARVALHDLVAERDLAVAAERHAAVAAHANDRGAVKVAWSWRRS